MASPTLFLQFHSPFLWIVVLSVLLGGCQTNPYTDRSQFLLMPSGYMNQMGAAQYGQMMQDPKVTLSKDPQRSRACQANSCSYH